MRNGSASLSERLRAAPAFTREARACYVGEAAVLAKAWLNHPQGGRVRPGCGLCVEPVQCGAVVVIYAGHEVDAVGL